MKACWKVISAKQCSIKGQNRARYWFKSLPSSIQNGVLPYILLPGYGTISWAVQAGVFCWFFSLPAFIKVGYIFGSNKIYLTQNSISLSPSFNIVNTIEVTFQIKARAKCFHFKCIRIKQEQVFLANNLLMTQAWIRWRKSFARKKISQSKHKSSPIILNKMLVCHRVRWERIFPHPDLQWKLELKWNQEDPRNVFP